ncbi:MAG: ATP-dependent sacrificial sulfur transferase LarE [Myxococcales bacterium]|nr:ATP-dependent sacrificial sulfur transferase LarE [Myxococcales bacterium]
MNDVITPLARLESILRDLDRVLVAFSGGVDSTFLLQVAVDVLGDRATGLIAVSPSLPPWELEEARRLAAAMGTRLMEVPTHEMERAGYRQNGGDRCYHCKTELFEVAAEAARRLDLGQLCYGAIPDDLGDHRPGMRAADERAVRAPLIEAGLDKAAIRALSRTRGLPTWDKPAGACLSSRFPAGTAIDPERLGKVTRCEAGLHALGFRLFRARFHDDLVRIELDPVEMQRLFADPALQAAVMEAGRAAGFRHVTVDLRGYRTGSGNDALITITG